MRVLGVTAEGDSGAAIVEDGRILAAVNEERLCRKKMVMGVPRGAIAEVCRVSGTAIDDLDAVLIASTRDLLIDELEPFDGWFQHEAGGMGGVIKRAAGAFSRYHGRIPALEHGYYGLLAPSFAHRRHALRRILRTEFGVRRPIVFVDHHLAHVASAYLTSGFRDALVMSVDGGGDGKSSLIYAVRDGRFEYLHETSAFNSLGNYYAYVTHLCGFKAMKHEGKITGLAAYGEPRYVPILRSLIDEERGTLVNRGVAFRAALADLERRLPAGWTREDLAASIQAHFEDVMRRYADYWARRTGLRNLAAAGGVFANVRVNEEVHNLPSIDRIFIHPHMGDGGLGAGAALAACIPGILPTTMRRDPTPLPHVWLSAPITDDDIARAMRKYQLEPTAVDGPMDEHIAELLAKGYVVARAIASGPYGPRALGNRSILYQPTDRSVNDWLNKNLHRTEFMPFAPSVLYEERERCFEGLAGADGVRMRWANAGHPPPFLLGPDGRVSVLGGRFGDLMLGVDPTAERAESTLDVDPGSVVLLYTDGLIERRGSTLDDGLDRLRRGLEELAGRPLGELCDALLERMLQGTPEDDVALVALLVRPGSTDRRA